MIENTAVVLDTAHNLPKEKVTKQLDFCFSEFEPMTSEVIMLLDSKFQ